MPKDFFERSETGRRLRDNPLASHLPPFTASLVENGYVKSLLSKTLAAAHLKQTGRAGLALGLLQQGWAVRQLLRQSYGIDSRPSWDDAAERRTFLQTLRFARLRAVN